MLIIKTTLYQKLVPDLLEYLTPGMCLDRKTYEALFLRIGEGLLTREENPKSHFCVIFVPFNPQTRKVFIVDHRKARQWVAPGGHVQKGETLEDGLLREVKEELGIAVSTPKPFMLSTMEISNAGEECLMHHDVWYLLSTTEELLVELKEFHDVKWVSFAQARKIITHPIYLAALNRVENLLKNEISP